MPSMAWALASSDEPEVGEQHVRAAQGDAPARVRAFVPFDHLDDFEDRLAVDLEKALGEGDPLGAAVALDLALVGIELELPQAAVGEQRSERVVDRRQDLGLQPAGVAVEADAQVPLGIAVADEEPGVGRARAEDRRGSPAPGPRQQERSAVEVPV